MRSDKQLVERTLRSTPSLTMPSRFAEGGRPTGTVETPGGTIQMTWSPDGKTIVLGNTSDVVSWIDTESQQVIKQIKMAGEVSIPAHSPCRLALVARLGAQWIPCPR